ncbi:hypothetical protein GGF46_004741, partial [Coemansia sp. RSA 552]
MVRPTKDMLQQRYKLRVNFVGVDAYDTRENVLPYRKLIYLAYATQHIGEVRRGIEAMFTRLYPDDGAHKVVRLRDSHMCDVSDDFLVSDVFDDSPEVYAAMDALVSNTPISPGFDGPLGARGGERPRLSILPKRKRYTLTPSKDQGAQSFSDERPGYTSATRGGGSVGGSKHARLESMPAAGRRPVRPESVSPELTPLSPRPSVYQNTRSNGNSAERADSWSALPPRAPAAAAAADPER